MFLVACSGGDRERGRVALQIGDYQRAQEAWNNILDQHPDDPEARTGVAMACFSAAQEKEREHLDADSAWWESLRTFRILLRIDSSRTNRGLASTSLFQVARRRLAAERPDDAVRLLHEAVRLDSTNWFAWNLLALANESLGQDARALELYEHIIVHEADFVTAYVNLGNLQWRRGEILAAWENWSLGLELDSTNTYLQQWTARAEEQLRQTTKAD